MHVGVELAGRLEGSLGGFGVMLATAAIGQDLQPDAPEVVRAAGEAQANQERQSG